MPTKVTIVSAGVEIFSDNHAGIYVDADAIPNLIFQLQRALADEELHRARILSSVPDGWHPIMCRLMAELSLDFPDARIVYAKEKFGGLRVRLKENDDLAMEVVNEHIKEAAQTCQRCGAAGRMRVDERMGTLCDEHAEQ
jgi:hypothetical protein